MTTIALVPKQKTSDEVRKSVVKVLKEALDLAEAGEIDTAIIILGHTDGEWSSGCSSTENVSEAIGRLEITKQEWISSYLCSHPVLTNKS